MEAERRAGGLRKSEGNAKGEVPIRLSATFLGSGPRTRRPLAMLSPRFQRDYVGGAGALLSRRARLSLSIVVFFCDPTTSPRPSSTRVRVRRVRLALPHRPRCCCAAACSIGISPMSGRRPKCRSRAARTSDTAGRHRVRPLSLASPLRLDSLSLSVFLMFACASALRLD